MKIYKVLPLLMLLIMSAIQSPAQKKVDIVKFDWYKKLRKVDNDTTYVVNFWATWCMPCVAELPEFEKVYAFYKDKKVRVILVDLDFYKKLNITVIPYLEKTKIQSQVILLNEPNYDAWIDKVDKSWSGSIPATVIFNNQKKVYHFLEHEITFAEIDTILKLIL